MDRFILPLKIAIFFILTVVFLYDQPDQNEYNDFKPPVGEDAPAKSDAKTFYPPTKKKPYTRTTWKV